MKRQIRSQTQIICWDHLRIFHWLAGSQDSNLSIQISYFKMLQKVFSNLRQPK